MLNPMTRIRRSTAGLLLAFMALDVAVLIYMGDGRRQAERRHLPVRPAIRVDGA